jgi:hypothetical protein
VTLTARGYDGQVITGSGIQNPVQLQIPPHGQLARHSTELFGAAIEGRSGWVELAPSAPGGSGFFLLYNDGVQYCDGGALIAAPASRLVFPQVSDNTILSVINTRDEPSRAGSTHCRFTAMTAVCWAGPSSRSKLARAGLDESAI